MGGYILRYSNLENSQSQFAPWFIIYHNFYSNNPNIYGAIYNTHLDIEDLMTLIHNVGKLVSRFPDIFNIPIVIIET